MRIRRSGFTILEVALVLAIAGLIFLMVFVALPAIQRIQRDAERREDIIAFVEGVKNYQKNNRGSLPKANTIPEEIHAPGNNDYSKWTGFYERYIGKNVDPSGNNYALTVVECGRGIADAECNGGAGGEVFSKFYNDSLSSFPNDYKILVVLQAKCYGEKVKQTTNQRNLAMLYRMEGGGIYCNNT